MSTRKPIRVFFGTLSNTFYATQHYRATDLGDGTARFEITGVKYDVTDDILAAFDMNDIDLEAIREYRAEMQAREEASDEFSS